MATPTYEQIASITLDSSASSVTFSSIPQDYRDLVLVVSGSFNQGFPISGEIYFNGDTSNGSQVIMEGNGSGTSSTTATRMFFVIGTNGNSILNIMDYSATDKHKSLLIRSNDTAGSYVSAIAARWASTSAITSIELGDEGAADFNSGTTFALWGIAA